MCYECTLTWDDHLVFFYPRPRKLRSELSLITRSFYVLSNGTPNSMVSCILVATFIARQNEFQQVYLHPLRKNCFLSAPSSLIHVLKTSFDITIGVIRIKQNRIVGTGFVTIDSLQLCSVCVSVALPITASSSNPRSVFATREFFLSPCSCS